MYSNFKGNKAKEYLTTKMKLVLYNITHHNCPVDHREKTAFTLQQRQLILKNIHAEEKISEAVVLQTCNRLEFYMYAEKNFDCKAFLTKLIRKVHPPAADTWKKFSKLTSSIDVVHHLFNVAAGLDSQMLGENQVLSQVKSAYTESLDAKTSKFIFHRLFHNAFRVGKAVRTNTNINCGAVSVGLAVVELARKKIDLADSTTMLIGAGENAEIIARFLLKNQLPDLIIANRNRQKAKALVSSINTGNTISIKDIPEKLDQIDLLISTTAAAENLLTYQQVQQPLKNRKKNLLIIDVAVPRDIDPKINKFKCVSLYNIDDLNQQIDSNKQKRSREIPKAKKIVDDFTAKFADWYESLNLVPVISKLTKKATELAHTEARRYAKDFGPENTEKLKLFAESLVKKVLHGPITFVKKNADQEPSQQQLEAADLINKMFLSQEKRSR